MGMHTWEYTHGSSHRGTHTGEHTQGNTHSGTHTQPGKHTQGNTHTQAGEHTHGNTHMGTHTQEHTHGNTHTGTHTWEHTHGNTHTGTQTWEHTHDTKATSKNREKKDEKKVCMRINYNGATHMMEFLLPLLILQIWRYYVVVAIPQGVVWCCLLQCSSFIPDKKLSLFH